jgi:CO/xanthine dehydrogenase Mo-binding subunit
MIDKDLDIVQATEYAQREYVKFKNRFLDQAGKILAFRMHWLCDQGAYLTQAGPLINTSNGNVMGCGVYTMPLIYGRHQLVMTNTCPTNAYRGAGRPDVAYLLERLVDEAAIGLNIDRVELRRRNLVPKEAMPYTTPLGSVYDSGDYPGQLEMAVRESDWAGFAARRAASASKVGATASWTAKPPSARRHESLASTGVASRLPDTPANPMAICIRPIARCRPSAATSRAMTEMNAG